MTIQQELQQALEKTLTQLTGTTQSAVVTPAADTRYGDYQTNAAMMLAKKLGKNPRVFAQEIMDALELSTLAEVELAGPGFVNFRIKPEALSARMEALTHDDRLGVEKISIPKKIVLDFSAPNVAKPMHVGHIRSTIIGDSLARIARFLGHDVITDNHIGDWGTQFGMVTWAWKNGVNEELLEKHPLLELLRLYRSASEASKADESIKEACRLELVKLQQGDPENLAIWKRCVALSRTGLDEIYDRLDVKFDYWLGESSYNDALAPLVQKLLDDGIAQESQGAICIFSDGSIADQAKDPFRIRKESEWEDFPMIVRKSDGGFNYATTDIATIEFRVQVWHADAIWYVVDHRQSLHFTQLFQVANRLGYQSCDFRHISFGTILGKDGKPLKTRAGDLPQLADVLDDSVSAARVTIAERSRLDSDEEKESLAELIGISAVKFTELSHHRSSDYVFDLEKMVALEGDTAPYLFYSCVRSRSIFRKLETPVDVKNIRVNLTHESELNLARQLSRFAEIVPAVLDDCRPNLLTSYLLDTARAFHSFFEACPVLKEEESVKNTRLALCLLTSETLSKGLSLLGIVTPEKM